MMESTVLTTARTIWEEIELSVPQMGPEGEAQPDLGRRETHESLGPIGKNAGRPGRQCHARDACIYLHAL